MKLAKFLLPTRSFYSFTREFNQICGTLKFKSHLGAGAHHQTFEQGWQSLWKNKHSDLYLWRLPFFSHYNYKILFVGKYIKNVWCNIFYYITYPINLWHSTRLSNDNSVSPAILGESIRNIKLINFGINYIKPKSALYVFVCFKKPSQSSSAKWTPNVARQKTTFSLLSFNFTS